MANSPELDAEGVVRVTLFSEGAALSEAMQIISVTVESDINRVPTALLVIVDGSMPNMQFPISDTNDFKPGAAIKINASYGDDEKTIFEGIVIKHAVQITGNNDARLVIECCDKAVKMTVGRKNVNYVDKLDSDVISALIASSGLTAHVETTPVQHKELVQYYCTDWDFMLARADANGLLVIASSGSVAAISPDTGATPALEVTYGNNLMEFHAELDSRSHYTVAQAVSWDMKTQAVVMGTEARPIKLNTQGDLSSAKLAEALGLASCRLQTATPTSKDALTQWAKAQHSNRGLRGCEAA